MKNKERALLIFPRTVSSNDRGVVSTIEEYKEQYNIIVLGIGFNYKDIDFDCIDLLFGVKKRFFRGIYTRGLIIPALIIFLIIILLKKPKTIYVRELTFLIPFYFIKFIFRDLKLDADIREIPNYDVRSELFFRFFKIKVDQYYTNSPILRNLLKEKYGLKDVELKFALPSKEFIRNINLEKYSKSEKLKLCFFGNISPDRKLEIPIKGVNRIDPSTIDFSVFGKCRDQQYLKYLISIVQNKNIFFEGEIEYKSSPGILVEYDCGVLINELNENSTTTIPGKLWEYTACGLCLLSNKRPTVMSIIDEYEAGLYFESAEDFSQRLEYLIQNKNKLMDLKLRSRTLFEGYYSSSRNRFSQ